MLNHIDLMGRLTADPVLKTTQNGISYVTFTLACDRDLSGKVKQTDFFRVKAWRQTAEFVNNYFHKGQMAIVSGRGQIEEFTDREGNKVKMFEIQADRVYFGSAAKAEVGETKFTEIPDDGEELPF